MTISFPEMLARTGVDKSSDYIAFNSKNEPILKTTSTLGRFWAAVCRKLGIGPSKIKIAENVSVYAEAYFKEHNQDKVGLIAGLSSLEYRLFKKTKEMYNPLAELLDKLDPRMSVRLSLNIHLEDQGIIAGLLHENDSFT